MSWITVDTDLPDHAKMAKLPSDAARWGWVVVLCEAKQQRRAGTFADANHFRYVMGRYGRFLEAYKKARLIDQDEDGTLHVHDWKRHQWAVSKAQQRENSDGHVEDKSETSVGQKKDASRAVSVRVPVSVSSTEGVQGEPDAVDALHRRTGDVPGPKLRSWINELADKHGEGRVASMIAATPLDGMTPPDYLKAVQNRLRLDDIAAERADRVAEERRVAEKRAALRPLPPAADISEAEAKRLAAEYVAEAKR